MRQKFSIANFIVAAAVALAAMGTLSARAADVELKDQVPNRYTVQKGDTLVFTLKEGDNGGWIYKYGVIDFAGGTAVHINAGAAGLALVVVMGKRIGFGKVPMRPHNLPFVILGASLLYFGWFGFNAGSALAADAEIASGGSPCSTGTWPPCERFWTLGSIWKWPPRNRWCASPASCGPRAFAWCPKSARSSPPRAAWMCGAIWPACGACAKRSRQKGSR